MDTIQSVKQDARIKIPAADNGNATIMMDTIIFGDKLKKSSKHMILHETPKGPNSKYKKET